MTAAAAEPAFVTCDFRGVWKVGKLDPEAPFGLPETFTGDFTTQAEAEEHARRCTEAATPGWVRYARGERSL
jgi:hypothetical protein